MRDQSERGVEEAHMRTVALKAQLVEVQSKLQSQVLTRYNYDLYDDLRMGTQRSETMQVD